jgi:hypothetical protein
VYAIRTQGEIYHEIGGFHPNQGSRPRFLHLYIYMILNNEIQNRMMESPQLHQIVVYKLKNMFRQCNSFVIKLRQLAL